jgi:hypothetical protein
MKTFAVVIAAVAATETSTVASTTGAPVSSSSGSSTTQSGGSAGFDQCKAGFGGSKSFRGTESITVRSRPWEMKECPINKTWEDFVEKDSLAMYDTSSDAKKKEALAKLQKVCDIPEFVTKETGSYPLSMIAKAYKAAGLSKQHCKDALIIAGGECQNDDKQTGHCLSSGPSGVFQCDSCVSALSRSPDFHLFKNLDNVCYNVWAQFVVQVVPELGGDFEIDPQNGKYNPRCLPMKNDWKDKDMFQEVSEFNDNACSCNAMGPFCHKTFLGTTDPKQQTAPAGNAWAGGSHLAHPQPHFQAYYRGRFLVNLGLYKDGITWYNEAPAGFKGKKWLESTNKHDGMDLPVLTDEAEQWLYEQSEAEAQKICDAVN